MKLLIFRNAFTSFAKLKSVFIPHIILFLVFFAGCFLTGYYAHESYSEYCIITTMSILLIQVSVLNIQFFSYVFYEKRSLGVFELELRAGCSKAQIFFERLILNIVLTIGLTFIYIALFAIVAIPMSHSYARITYIYCYSFFGVIIFDFILKGILSLFVGINRQKIALSITSVIMAIGVLNPLISTALSKATTVEMSADKEDKDIFNEATADEFGVDFQSLYLANRIEQIKSKYADGLLNSMSDALTNIDQDYLFKLVSTQDKDGNDWEYGLKRSTLKNPGTDSKSWEDWDDIGTTGTLISAWSSIGLDTDTIFKMNADGVFYFYRPDNAADLVAAGNLPYEYILGEKGEEVFDSSLNPNSENNFTTDWGNDYLLTGDISKISATEQFDLFKNSISKISVADGLKNEWNEIVSLVLDLYNASFARLYNGEIVRASGFPLYTKKFDTTEFAQFDTDKIISMLKNVNPYICQLRSIILMLATFNEGYTVENFFSNYHQFSDESKITFSWLNKIHLGGFNRREYLSKYVTKWFKVLAHKSKMTYLNPFVAYNSLIFNMGTNVQKNIYYGNDTMSTPDTIFPYGPINLKIKEVTMDLNTVAHEIDSMSFKNQLYYNIPVMFIVPIVLSSVMVVIGWFVLKRKFII